jgi:hypothetical protein
MKKFIISIICIIFVFGCTAPTQPSAERDLQVAQKQFATITYDLAMKAKYAEFMRAYDLVQTSQDPNERAQAVQQMSNAYTDIEFLLVEAEKAKGLLREGREWVRAQRGVFNVLIEKWSDAKKVVSTTSQPSVTTSKLPEAE